MAKPLCSLESSDVPSGESAKLHAQQGVAGHLAELREGVFALLFPVGVSLKQLSN